MCNFIANNSVLFLRPSIHNLITLLNIHSYKLLDLKYIKKLILESVQNDAITHNSSY